MKREELTEILRQEYSEKRGCGVAKVDDPEYQNIWFVVPPPVPRELAVATLPLDAMSKAHTVFTRLPGYGEMSSIDKVINHFFVRREAVESSRMEGTWSTIDDVLTPAEVHDTQKGKSENESVRGYALALEKQFERAFKKKEKVFSERTVCEIHKDIVSKDPSYRGTPGAIRTRPVLIGRLTRKEDSTYNPAPPSHVKRCLQDVLAWLSDEGLAQQGDAGVAGFTLAVRLAIGHAHFEAVHPFSDGNGRVGRALWPLQMICADRMPLYLSGYVEAQRDGYGDALQQAQKKLNYRPLIEFICDAIVQSAEEANVTRKAIESLPARWKERAKFRAKSASERSLEILMGNPIITTTILMDLLKIPRQSATEAIHQLVERKVIRHRGSSGKTQVYAAEELIALLSRQFGSNAEEALEKGYQSLNNLL